MLAGGAGLRARPLDKLLVRGLDGRTVLERTVAAIRGSGARPIVLVCGHAAGRLSGICPELPRVVAADHAEGLAASLRAGIARAGTDGWRAALVCLGDMPLVWPATIDRLIEAHRRGGDAVDVVLPLAAGRRGNPLLWDRRQFAALGTLRGDAGGRALLAAPGLRCLQVETGDPGVLADFDTPERLAAFASGR